MKLLITRNISIRIASRKAKSKAHDRQLPPLDAESQPTALGRDSCNVGRSGCSSFGASTRAHSKKFLPLALRSAPQKAGNPRALTVSLWALFLRMGSAVALTGGTPSPNPCRALGGSQKRLHAVLPAIGSPYGPRTGVRWLRRSERACTALRHYPFTAQRLTRYSQIYYKKSCYSFSSKTSSHVIICL